MTIEAKCRQVHEVLANLPADTDPRRLQFRDGLYLFYETTELSTHGCDGRIVRVGNHPRSSGGLVRRLRQHYGGRKNGSVFRKLVGGALMRRSGEHPCLAPAPGKGHWEVQGGTTCERCSDVEQQVSLLLRSSFRFRCVAIGDPIERARFEEAIIATLAQCSICAPTPDWLGRYAYSEIVRSTGLWNSQFTGGATLTEAELKRLCRLVEETQGMAGSGLCGT